MKGHVSGHKCGVGGGELHRQHELLVRPLCQARVPSGLLPESVTFVLLHQMQIDKTRFVCFLFFCFCFLVGGCKVCLYFTEGKGRGGAFIKPVAPLLSVLHTALSLTASTSLALFPHVPAG